MTSVEAEILALEEQLRAGDASPAPDTGHVFDTLLSDDVLFVQPGSNMTGKSGVVKGHQPPRKRTFTQVECSDVAVRQVSPEVVLVACVTRYSLADRSFSSRTLRVWTRTGGLWKVAAVAMMPEPPPEA